MCIIIRKHINSLSYFIQWFIKDNNLLFIVKLCWILDFKSRQDKEVVFSLLQYKVYWSYCL